MAQGAVDLGHPVTDPEAIRADMAKTRETLTRELGALKGRLFGTPTPAPQRGRRTVAVKKSKAAGSAKKKAEPKKSAAASSARKKAAPKKSSRGRKSGGVAKKAKQVLEGALAGAAAGAVMGAVEAATEGKGKSKRARKGEE